MVSYIVKLSALAVVLTACKGNSYYNSNVNNNGVKGLYNKQYGAYNAGYNVNSQDNYNKNSYNNKNENNVIKTHSTYDYIPYFPDEGYIPPYVPVSPSDENNVADKIISQGNYNKNSYNNKNENNVIKPYSSYDYIPYFLEDGYIPPYVLVSPSYENNIADDINSGENYNKNSYNNKNENNVIKPYSNYGYRPYFPYEGYLPPYVPVSPSDGNNVADNINSQENNNKNSHDKNNENNVNKPYSTCGCRPYVPDEGYIPPYVPVSPYKNNFADNINSQENYNKNSYNNINENNVIKTRSTYGFRSYVPYDRYIPPYVPVSPNEYNVADNINSQHNYNKNQYWNSNSNDVIKGSPWVL